MLDDLRASGVQAPRAVPRGRRADAADALQGDPAPAPAGADGQRRRRDRARARAAGAAARARRRRDRHHRADRRDAAPQARRRDAADAHARPARGHVRELRLQVRAGARSGRDVRRPLPAQPALRAGAAAADRKRPAGRRRSSTATASSTRSTSGCTRCSTTCCRSTWPRARRTWCSRSAAPAAATARSRSPSTWRSATEPTRSTWSRSSTATSTERPGVIDHVGFEVSDLRALGALLRRGLLRARRAADVRSEHAVAYGVNGPEFWIVVRGRTPGPGYGHVALHASGKAAVDAALSRRASPTAARTTGRPGRGRSTAGATTRPTCATPTGCGSRSSPGR